MTRAPFVAGLDPVALGLSYGDYHVRAIATDRSHNVDPNPSSITLKYADITAPATPGDLKASVNGENVTLTWAANMETDLNGYNIYRTSGSGQKTRLNSNIVKEATYQDSGLADGTYAYTVTALDNYENESPVSSAVFAKIFTPGLSQPYTPTASRIIPISGSNTGSGNTVEIFVDYGAGPVSQGTSVADAQGAFTFPGVTLTAGENRITATAGDRSGDLSRPAESIYVVYNEPPVTPAGFLASVQEHNVSLIWNSNVEPDMAGYNLYKNGTRINESVSLTSGMVTASSSSDSNLPFHAFDGNSDTYWASASSVSLDSPAWLEIDFPSPELINRLEVDWHATGEEFCGGANYEIQVWSGHAWITQASVTGNEVKQTVHDFSPSYRTDKIRIYVTGVNGYFLGLTDVKISKDNLLTQTGYSDPGLSDGQYQYKLTAVDYYGFESSPTAEEKAAVGDVIPPDAPLNLSASVSGSTVTLKWDASIESGLAGYFVYRKSGEIWVRFNASPVITDLHVDTGLKNGSYVYRVTAIDAAGNESSSSSEVQATVAVTAPQVPGSLSIVSFAQGGALSATWNYSGQDPAGYHLYRGTTSGGPYAKINGSAIDTNSYLDSNVTNGASYYYVVVAVDAAGNESTYSNEATGVPLNCNLAKPAIYYPAVPVVPVVTDVAVMELFGNAESNTMVELFRNGSSTGRVTASATDADKNIPLPKSSSSPALSPDGRMLVYDQDSSFIWIMTLVDGSTQQIGLGYGLFSWSPDSTRFAYLNDEYRIIIYDRKTGVGSSLTSDSDIALEDTVSWSLDGTKVSLVRMKLSDATTDVWVKNFRTGELKRLTNSGMVRGAKISPDGNRVAYFDNSENGNYNDLYMIDARSLAVVKIDSMTDGFVVNWSPDGKQLAYVSLKDERAGILIADAETNEIIKNIPSTVSAINPVWAPDGRHMLFIQQNSDGTYSLLEILLSSNETTTLSSNLNVNWGYLDWTKSGDIAYFDYARHQMNKITRKGKFNFTDVALSDGANVFYVVSTDASNSSAASEEIAVTFASSRPDLKVTAKDITIYPPYLKPGEKASIHASVNNTGMVEARNVDVEIYILSDGTSSLLKRETIPSIAVGTSQMVQLEWSGAVTSGLHTLYVEIDPDDTIAEASKGNNSAFQDIIVMEQTGAGMTTGLDASRYGSQQNVNIGVNIRNSGASQRATLEVAVEDANGVTVAALTSVDLQVDYAATRNFDFVWNTASFPGGVYHVHASLKSDQGILTENIIDFTIVSEIRLDPVSVITDKALYKAGENAEISVNLTNAGQDFIIPELTVKIRIANPADNIVFTDHRMLKNLPAGSTCIVKNLWNIAVSLPGDYRVFLEVYAGADLIATRATTFSIVTDVTVTGSIVAPGAVSQGMDVKLDYTFRNAGNADVNNLPVRVLVVDPDSQEVLGSMESTIDLPLNMQKSGTCQLSTTGYKLKSFFAILQILHQGSYKNIFTATFMVRDGTPPIVTILKPITGAACTSAIDFAVTVVDDLSSVAKVEYQIDEGEWKYLPVSDAVVGRYSTAWNPTAAEEGTHTIRFRATDQAQNTSFPVSRNITVSLKPVKPPIIHLPLTGSTLSSDVVDIKGASDPGLTVAMEFEGNIRTLPTDSTTGSFVFPTVKLTPGLNSFTFYAQDQTGKTSVKTSYALIYLPVNMTVVTDKPAYSINENVTITARIANVSTSYAVNDLTAKLTLVDASGRTQFMEEQTIATLAAGTTREIKKDWNTSVNLKGIYTAKLQIYRSVGLPDVMESQFEVLGTSVTGDGITGVITASPGQVTSPDNEVLDYSVGNAGNEGLSVVLVKTQIYQTATQMPVMVFADQTSIPKDGSIAGSHNVSTALLSPGIYRAELSAKLPALATPRKLAVVEFEVKGSVKITKMIDTATANLIVWMNERCKHHDSGFRVNCDDPKPAKTCIRMDLLERILHESGANYYFVYNSTDFTATMRNPFYTDFIILGDHEPMGDHHADELREQIYSGKGLISSLYFWHGRSDGYSDETLFGVRYRGSLPGDRWFLRIPLGTVFDVAAMEARGGVLRIEAEKTGKCPCLDKMAKW